MILLLSHSADYFTIDNVQTALQQKGIPYYRLNTDLFPSSLQIAQSIGTNDINIQLIDEAQNKIINTSEFTAVWTRKIWQAKINTDLDPQFRAACIKESKAVMTALFAALNHLPWLDPLPNMYAGEDKLFQLKTARKAGLNIPETLITNNPKEVRTFYQQQKGNVIVKMLTALSHGMKASSFFVYTNQLAPEDLEDLEGLSCAPMIFQASIPKAYELRVIYVNGECFTGKIKAIQAVGEKVNDWRAARNIPHSPWESYDIPKELQVLIQKFMQQMQLNFGAIDIIRTPEGKYIFLEVNPSGEWGMLERDLNLPISQAIANYLAEVNTTLKKISA